MTLEGYRREPGGRNGGITALALIDIDDLGEVEFDRRTGNAVSIETVEGASFALYHFKEDTARFTENTVSRGGFFKYTRRVTFTLEKLDEREQSAARQLLREDRRGLAAVALCASGGAYILGVGRRSGKKFPMRVTTTALDSGGGPADTAGETFTLYNEDICRAALYTGEQAAVFGQ